MNERYLARGETTMWFHVGRAIMALGAAAGFAIYFWCTFKDKNVIAGLVGVPCFLICLMLEFWAAKKRFQRLWIEVRDDGFLIQDRSGEREFRDSQVTAMAYTTKNLFESGVPRGSSRLCKLWIGDKKTPIIFENQFTLTQVDPLGAFIQRVADLLGTGFIQALDHNLVLEGDGFKLSNRELTCSKGRREESISIADIKAIEDRDGKMRVWRQNEELHCAEFPVDGRNVWILRNVLNAMIAKNAASGKPPTGLGRVLFQRGANKGSFIVLGIFALVMIAIGVGIYFDNSSKNDFVAAVICAAIGLGFALLGLFFAFTKLRCHERGVVKRGLFGTKQLMYEHVKAFTCSATRQYYHGAYIGTHLKIRFDPISIAEFGSAISFGTSVQNADDELDRLRDFISKVIAVRMQRELAAGVKVVWTNNMSFLPDGIEYKPGGIFGRKDPVFMPYSDYGGSNFSAGEFCLFEKGNTNPVMKEATSIVNFFPGWFLLQTIMAPK
ncbi:MAG: hypothetical protein WCT04_07215 [Planctomycetota bacterium]